MNCCVCVFLFDCDCIVFVELIRVLWQRAPRGRYSCKAQGASPGLIIETHLLSPKGAALPKRKANACVVSAAPAELILFLSVCTQGFISGFALIPPWAMKSIVPTALIIRLNFDAVALLALP